jgi:type I restriction enzyme M protein
MTEQKRKLEQKLWDVANNLRGNMDASDFRDYTLGFIFYKYLSEKIEALATEELKNDEITFIEAYENEEYREALKDEFLKTLGYFIEPKYLFHNIVERGEKGGFVLDDLGTALKLVEQSALGEDSEEEFADLFEDVDLTSSKLGKSTEEKNKLIVDVIKNINEIDFALDDTEIDVLGDAYEYLIKQFASNAGKKAGEFYTPQEVSTVLARIVTAGKTKIASVYDPTCGSGSLLLRVKKECEVGSVYGQEKNPTTYNLARMNMLLHDVPFDSFEITQGDTLEYPQHMDKKFEAVVANPPFSAKWSADQTFLSDERFSQYGKLAPKSKADFAFVQHMIYHLSENGTLAVVLPHGVLFRSAAEGVIRKYLIQDRNYLDAVIGLPANLFYGTGIPTCILVFKKCRESADDILFIDSSKEFEKVKTQNMLLPEHIDKIVNTYVNREELDKYSYSAPLSEVEENDFNLNIPRYVDTFEEEEEIDLEAVANEIIEIDKQMVEVDAEIKKFCEELGIKAPVL